MREIKFKCLTECSEEHVKLGFPKLRWAYYGLTGKHLFPEYKQITPDLQYTGLKDKNGKEIYEGDICRVKYYNHSMPNTEIIQEVVFENGCFCLKSKIASNLNLHLEDTRQFVPIYYSLAPNKIEVIGNIYENPELLNPTPLKTLSYGKKQQHN